MEADPAKPAISSQLAGAGPGFAALVLGVLNMSFSACMCGHVEWSGLPGNLVAVSLAWWAACVRRGDSPRTAKFVLLVCVIANTHLLLKNLADIGWNGHSPVFSSVNLQLAKTAGSVAVVSGLLGLVIAAVWGVREGKS